MIPNRPELADKLWYPGLGLVGVGVVLNIIAALKSDDPASIKSLLIGCTALTLGVVLVVGCFVLEAIARLRPTDLESVIKRIIVQAHQTNPMMLTFDELSIQNTASHFVKQQLTAGEVTALFTELANNSTAQIARIPAIKAPHGAGDHQIVQANQLSMSVSLAASLSLLVNHRLHLLYGRLNTQDLSDASSPTRPS